ncbi:MAG TPA: Ku protein [Candidatus Kapabacteria bacterium]|nr:Ku protein [Candidatus Kapabacteria bacterium]
MRAIWSGSLSFGLVNIPVKLYSAVERKELSFHYLHATDLSPIRFAKVCRADGQEIAYEDIVKGYEYEDGDYIVLTEEDFEKANVKETHVIDIEQFVREQEIDTKLFERPYYMGPEKGAAKAYTLLTEALKKAKKVGIAKFVLRKREHLCAVKPEGHMLILHQMRFQEELRSPEEITIPETTESGKKEIDMALELIDYLTAPFRPEQHKDTYTDAVKAVIEEKASGKVPAVRGHAPEPVKVKDLMAVLRQSLEQEKQHPGTKTPRRKTTSRKKQRQKA